MKVLCLTEAVGNDPSYRARVLAYLPTLANAGFHVEIIPFAQNAWRRRRWDVLWIRRSGLEEAIADELSGKPVVYDFDDAMFCLPDDLVRTRTRTVGLVTRLEARFANAIRAARVVIAGSNYLRERAVAHRARRVIVIRTGVAVPPKRLEFSDRRPQCVLVWTGSTPTLPFLEMMRPVLSRFTKASGSVLRIICDRFPRWPDVRHECIPWTPDAGLRDLASATIGIAPLPDSPYARGKCAYKIAQYMAAGLPVLASPVGANVELFELGCRGILEAEASCQVHALEMLSADPVLCERWGDENRNSAAEHLDLRVLGTKLVDALREASG